MSTGQEVCADHFQTVAARFVGSEHQSCGLKSLLDDWDLALIELEVDDLVGFCVPAREVLYQLLAPGGSGQP